MARTQYWQQHTRQARSAKKQFFDKLKKASETNDISLLGEAVKNVERTHYLRNVLNPPSRDEKIKQLKRAAKQRRNP